MTGCAFELQREFEALALAEVLGTGGSLVPTAAVVRADAEVPAGAPAVS